jgi:hypothetical protein
MYYEKLEQKSETEFKRLTGVKRPTFKVMVDILEAQYLKDHELGGKPSKLPIKDKLLMTLEYWREYRTYFHIGNSYGYSESQAYKSIKWVENTLIKSGKFSLPGKKILHTLDKEALILIDVTESPIERPKKRST